MNLVYAGFYDSAYIFGCATGMVAFYHPVYAVDAQIAGILNIYPDALRLLEAALTVNVVFADSPIDRASQNFAEHFFVGTDECPQSGFRLSQNVLTGPSPSAALNWCAGPAWCGTAPPARRSLSAVHPRMPRPGGPTSATWTWRSRTPTVVPCPPPHQPHLRAGRRHPGVGVAAELGGVLLHPGAPAPARTQAPPIRLAHRMRPWPRRAAASRSKRRMLRDK